MSVSHRDSFVQVAVGSRTCLVTGPDLTALLLPDPNWQMCADSSVFSPFPKAWHPSVPPGLHLCRLCHPPTLLSLSRLSGVL